MVSNRKFSKAYDLVSSFEKAAVKVSQAQDQLSDHERFGHALRMSFIKMNEGYRKAKTDLGLDGVSNTNSWYSVFNPLKEINHLLSIANKRNFRVSNILERSKNIEAIIKSVIHMDVMVDHLRTRLIEEGEEVLKKLTRLDSKLASASISLLSKAQGVNLAEAVSSFEKAAVKVSQAQEYTTGPKKHYINGNNPRELDDVEFLREVVAPQLEKLGNDIKYFLKINKCDISSEQNRFVYSDIIDDFVEIDQSLKFNVNEIIKNILSHLSAAERLPLTEPSVKLVQKKKKKMLKQPIAFIKKLLSQVTLTSHASSTSIRNKRAQGVSLAEQEVNLKREIEELMTKGLNSAVRPYWNSLVSVVTQLKQAGKLPANLNALDYYQPIVYGGISQDRRVRFATSFPKVVMDLGILAASNNIDKALREDLYKLSQAVNGPCDGIKNKSAELAEVLKRRSTDGDEDTMPDEVRERMKENTPEDLERTRNSLVSSKEEVMGQLSKLVSNLLRGGNRSAALDYYNKYIGSSAKRYMDDPGVSRLIMKLVDLGIPANPSEKSETNVDVMLTNLKNMLSAANLDSLSGDAKLLKSQQVSQKFLAALAAVPHLGKNSEFKQILLSLIDSTSSLDDKKLEHDIASIKRFVK